MNRIIIKKERGFTIIEVLIVLVIGGIILTAVFVAIPQLQRNQRNYGRKQDVRLLVAAVQECINLNRKAELCRQSDRIRLDPEVSFAVFEDFTVQNYNCGGNTIIDPVTMEQVSNTQTYLGYKYNLGCKTINNIHNQMPVIWIGRPLGYKCEDIVTSGGGVIESDNPNAFAINYPLEGQISFFGASTPFCTDNTFNSRKG